MKLSTHEVSLLVAAMLTMYVPFDDRMDRVLAAYDAAHGLLVS